MSFFEMDPKHSDLIKEVISKDFSYLLNLSFLYCGRDKKSKSSGEYVVAKAVAFNDFQKFISIDDNCPNGYDICIVLDENVFKNLQESDKKNFIKILLKTIEYDEKIKVNKYGVLNSQDLSEDEIKSYEKIQLIADQIYTTEKDM